MKKYNDKWFYKLLRPILKSHFKFFYKPTIIGIDNIPKNGRVILAGNHIDNLDCLLLISSTKRHIHFLAKKELFTGIKGIIFSNLGLIPVDRDKKNPNAIKDAEMYLNNDKVIGIFPEGTTEKGRGLLPFKLGAVKIANDTNTSIVPFKIMGRYKVFRKSITIVFGNKLRVETDNLLLENKRLRDIINEL